MADAHRHAPRRRFTRLAALAAGLGLVSGAFVSTSGVSAGAQGGGGGDITFGLEAETTGGFCLPAAQLAISGIQVTAAIYDTLAVPNSKGEFVPYLAESIEPNADFTEWTIKTREGVTFHDGTPFDAEALKLNLDTYAGLNPDQGAPLFAIINGPLYDGSTIVDPSTVTVQLKQPVPEYPSYLYGTGRVGMVAPAQLAAGPDCPTTMIGTGPYKLVDWKQNESLEVEANEDYWQKGFPKAGTITFIPQPDAAQRVTQLQGGELDMMHTSSGQQIARLQGLGGQFDLLEQEPGVREIRYYFVNQSQAPFNDPDARDALALAINKDEINEIQNRGVFDVANGLQDVDAPGYLKNAGFPKHNLKKAKQLVEQVKAASNGEFNVVLLTTNDTENSREAQALAEQLETAGMTADIQQVDQTALINQALGGNFGIFLWRNLHGGNTVNPDVDMFPWFGLTPDGSPYPTNFGRLVDPELQALLEQGRQEGDAAQIKDTYEQANQRVADDVGLIPAWYVDWTIASSPDVTVGMPKLPGGGKPLFVYGRIPVLGLSKS